MTDSAHRSSAPDIGSDADRVLLTYPDLDHPSLRHGIVVLKDLSFGTDYCGWLRVAARLLRHSLKPAPSLVTIPRQVHSTHIVDADTTFRGVSVGDGVVASRPLTAIGVTVSDCIPLFAVNLECGVIGLAHCGWRGIAGGVVDAFLRLLGTKGARPGRTTFLIGASIGQCCYQVGRDLLDRFGPREVHEHSTTTGRGEFFDLKGVVASRLVAAGALQGKISIDKTCTSCHKYVLCSYRADGRDCGRMLAFLMLIGLD